MNSDTIKDEVKNSCYNCDASSMEQCLRRGCSNFLVKPNKEVKIEKEKDNDNSK